jgi:hypothetical protein
MTVPYSEEIDELPPTEVGLLVSAEASAQDAITNRLVAVLLLLWAGFTEFWSGDDVSAFGTRSAALVQVAQRRVAGQAEQHLRRQLQRLDVETPASAIVDLPADLRLGADTADVYQRPIRKLRYLVSEGMEEAEAVQVAAERLEKQARTDLQLAKATAAQQTLYSVERVTGWRRIIHPELGSVCGLCIAASDRVYQRIERMDLHPGCRCTVLPIVVSGDGELRDPGRALNAADLSAIYAAAGNTTESRALSKTRIQVKENGELGRILMADGTEYKGPQKVERQLSPAAAERRLASIQSQLATLRAIENPSQWYLDRIQQLEELAS